MLEYDAYKTIAESVIAQLNLPSASDLTKETAEELDKKYLRNDTVIDELIDAELAKYDTSENNPSDVADIKSNASDEVFFTIDDIINNFYEMQSAITDNVYAEIVKLLKEANIANVESVEAEYEPADFDVGIYDEERYIDIKLTNGAIISFTVDFDEEW